MMLIRKGGITRDIDANRLHEYKVKGYTPVAPQAAPAAPKGEEQPQKSRAKE